MDDFDKPVNNRKVKKSLMLVGASASMLIGIGILFFLIEKILISETLSNKGQSLISSAWGQIGDLVAGVVGTLFSLAGVFLLFLTLKDQRDNFHRERMESNFFEMIKFHRENVNELRFSYYEKRNQMVTAEKRKVFKIIFVQFKQAWEELNHIFLATTLNDIYEDAYLKILNYNETVHQRNISLKQFAQVDILYLIVFFGLSEEDKQTILNLCKNRYKPEFIWRVLDFASLKPKRESHYWQQWSAVGKLKQKNQVFEEILRKRSDESYVSSMQLTWNMPSNLGPSFESIFYPNEYEKYYGGHQFRLGHYFRHIFQTIKFVDKEKHLTQEEKYGYVKILRGQLSNYEQIVFFLNSISEVGRPWELMKRNKAIKKDKHLITKYNLIKNIPMERILGEVNLSDYYPDIEFETTTRN